MQLEVGDMILWNDPEDIDIGWIVHTEERTYGDQHHEGLLLFIVWAKQEGEPETIWEEYLLGREYVTIIKGGQHDR